MNLHLHLSPELQGAIVGAAAATLAGTAALWGARAQAKAVLEAVRIEMRGQRHEANWQVSRDSYAAFFAAAEEVSAAATRVRAVRTVAIRHPGQAGYDLSEARSALADALTKVWFQQTLLGLSVPPLARDGVEGVVGQLRSLTGALNDWLDATFRVGEDVDRLDNALLSRFTDVRETIRSAIEDARVALDSAPTLDEPRRSVWRRVGAWRDARRVN